MAGRRDGAMDQSRGRPQALTAARNRTARASQMTGARYASILAGAIALCLADLAGAQAPALQSQNVVVQRKAGPSGQANSVLVPTPQRRVGPSGHANSTSRGTKTRLRAAAVKVD